MKFDHRNGLRDYELLKEILMKNPDLLKKYIKENLSKNQFDDLFPEPKCKEDEDQKEHHHESLQHLMIKVSNDEKGTDEMFFGRVASYMANVLGLPQENVKIFSRSSACIANKREQILEEFREKGINVIDQDETIFFSLRSGGMLRENLIIFLTYIN